MFRPNAYCTIQLSDGTTDVYGQPTPGSTVTERCAVVKLMIENEKSSVRADSSASRGSALELETTSVILLTALTKAHIDDIVTIDGYSFRVKGMWPRANVMGKLDHYQTDLTMWAST